MVLIHAAGEETGTTRNVSLGGMLIAMEGKLAFGTPVRMRITLPPLKESTEIEATVRWIKDDAVGVQFGSLRAKEVWALNQMFKSAPVEA